MIDRWTDAQRTDEPKSGLKRCMNEVKTLKNIENVFKLAETCFKLLCDKKTGGPTAEISVTERQWSAVMRSLYGKNPPFYAKVVIPK